MKTLRPQFYRIVPFLCLIGSCISKQDPGTSAPNSLPVLARYPTCDTMRLFEARYLSSAWTVAIGKYSAGEMVCLSQPNLRSIPEKDIIDQRYRDMAEPTNTNSLRLVVDYGEQVYFDRYGNRENQFYPVFLSNSSDSIKNFYLKDDYVLALQEALDSNGVWRPIETRTSDFCGVGHWGVKIHPGEFFVFLMGKYKGDFRTLLRVRIKSGDTIYTSDPFEGVIYYTQMTPEKGTYLEEYLENSNGENLDYVFLGARPLGF